jgi:hypothetical protein
MRVCLLTSDARHSATGERIAALAERMDDAAIAVTGTADWPAATHIDELSGSFDVALAFGWRACLHVFRVEAAAYGYVVPALEDAQLWHGDERRMLAALTYDLPLTLVAPSRAIARALDERAPGRRIVVVEPGITREDAVAGSARGGSPESAREGAASAPLRVASVAPADEILARASEPVEPAPLSSADVLLEIAAADSPLADTPRAMLAGVVPIVTPVDGHDTLVTDGEDGIVVGFYDVPGTARALDTLARDRDLLARLRDGALRRAEQLPTLDDEAAALLEALKNAEPPAGWPARLLLNARAVAEPIAEERRALDEALRSYEQRIEDLTAENERLRGEVNELNRGLVARLRRRYT